MTDDVKINNVQYKESEHTYIKRLLIFIPGKITGEKTSGFVMEIGKTEEKDKNHGTVVCYISNQRSLKFSALFALISKLIILSKQNMWLYN